MSIPPILPARLQYARIPAASFLSRILNRRAAHFSRRVAGGAGTEAALTGYSIYVAYSSSPRMSPSSFELYAQVPTQLDEPVSQAQCQPRGGDSFSRDSFSLSSPYSLSLPHLCYSSFVVSISARCPIGIVFLTLNLITFSPRFMDERLETWRRLPGASHLLTPRALRRRGSIWAACP